MVVRGVGAEVRQGHRRGVRPGGGHSGPIGILHAADRGDNIRATIRGVAGDDDIGKGGFPAGKSRLVSINRLAIGEER
jgi:hypothetical protein